MAAVKSDCHLLRMIYRSSSVSLRIKRFTSMEPRLKSALAENRDRELDAAAYESGQRRFPFPTPVLIAACA